MKTHELKIFLNTVSSHLLVLSIFSSWRNFKMFLKVDSLLDKLIHT